MGKRVDVRGLQPGPAKDVKRSGVVARLGALALSGLIAACAAPKPAESAAAVVVRAGADLDSAHAPSAVLGPVLHVGPIADGAIGPCVVDDGERTAMLLAQPKGNGAYRMDLAVETVGAPQVRTIADTLQPPRGFALALTAQGGVAVWIEGDKRATVVAVALSADGAALGAPRILPQGRVEPYWVAARMVEGRRVVIIAEQDAAGATIRARSLSDDGTPVSAPVTLAKRAVAWTSTRDIPLVLIREDGGNTKLEVLDVDGRGVGKAIASARLDGVSPRAVSRVDASGVGADLSIAVTVSEPANSVVVYRATSPNASKLGTLDGRVLAAARDGSAPAFLLAKTFPSVDGQDDLSLAVVDEGAVNERILPEHLVSSGARGESVPSSVVRRSDGGVVLALANETERPTVFFIEGSGAVSRASSPSGVGQGWNVRTRGDVLRLTRFENHGAGVDLVDGPFALGEREAQEPTRDAATDARTHFQTVSSRIASTSVGNTSYALRLESAGDTAKDGDMNAQSLRLVAVRDRVVTKDDRLTDRAQPTGSIHVAASKGAEPAIVTSWLARELGVQQGHALVLDAGAKTSPNDARAEAWPLVRKRHRQMTKAAGDVTEFALVPTAEGFVGAWIEQSGRDAAVVAASFDKNLERTSRFERVSVAGSQASDLVATSRGAGVWVAWIEGKGATTDAPKAVPTVARLAAHDARPELKPQALTAGDGLAGAIALASHDEGIVAVYIDREDAGAARVADEAEAGAAFLTVLLLDERGVPVGEPVQRGVDREGIPCDVALSSRVLALERCRPAAFSLELMPLSVTKAGVSLDETQLISRGLRPATQDRPLSIDDERVLWLQNDEAGNPWLRSFPLTAFGKGRKESQK